MSGPSGPSTQDMGTMGEPATTEAPLHPSEVVERTKPNNTQILKIKDRQPKERNLTEDINSLTKDEQTENNNAQQTEGNEWTQVDRKRNRRKTKTYQQLRKLQSLDEIFKTKEPHYNKYYTIRFPGCNLNEDISIIKLNADIKKQLPGAKVRKTGREILLVEVANKHQSEKIQKLKTLGQKTISVRQSEKLNQSKGVIRTKSLKHDSEAEIAEHLKDQDVVDVRRISIKKNGEIIETDTYIITFRLLHTPKTLTIADWLLVDVEEYQYSPQQCFNCLKFGHVAKYCRLGDPSCLNCGQIGHSRADCMNTTRCFHCMEQHPSNSKHCPKYISETRIVNLQMKNRMTKPEAIEKHLEENPQYKPLYNNPDFNKNENYNNQYNKYTDKVKQDTTHLSIKENRREQITTEQPINTLNNPFIRKQKETINQQPKEQPKIKNNSTKDEQSKQNRSRSTSTKRTTQNTNNQNLQPESRKASSQQTPNYSSASISQISNNNRGVSRHERDRSRETRHATCPQLKKQEKNSEDAEKAEQHKAEERESRKRQSSPLSIDENIPASKKPSTEQHKDEELQSISVIGGYQNK